jgi:hypothetical protein
MSMKLSVVGTLLVCTLAFPLAADAQFWESGNREYFRWKGRVDGVDDVLVRGSEVRIEHVSAMPIQKQDHRFSAPLPAAEVELRLEVLKGRGSVRLLEQPSKRNQYTAVIRLDDQEQSGASDYEFEISWSREDAKKGSVYDAVFRWRGRVDIGCEIHVQGSRHEVIDDGGSGTQERGANFSSPLPRSDVPVSLEKRKGRGRVELVQSPNAGNGFTAIVKIEDSKGGADDYDFELRWPKQ